MRVVSVYDARTGKVCDKAVVREVLESLPAQYVTDIDWFCANEAPPNAPAGRAYNALGSAFILEADVKAPEPPRVIDFSPEQVTRLLAALPNGVDAEALVRTVESYARLKQALREMQ